MAQLRSPSAPVITESTRWIFFRKARSSPLRIAALLTIRLTVSMCLSRATANPFIAKPYISTPSHASISRPSTIDAPMTWCLLPFQIDPRAYVTRAVTRAIQNPSTMTLLSDLT
jgi:hypothetical protein